MHRDVKPHNIMIDHSQRKLRLIDWGLAEVRTLWSGDGVGVRGARGRAPATGVVAASRRRSLPAASANPHRRLPCLLLLPPLNASTGCI